jgi:subtilisin family serine protease
MSEVCSPHGAGCSSDNKPSHSRFRHLTKLALALILLSHATAPAQVAILSDGFEGVFPGSWSVGDADPEGDAAYWADVDVSFGTPPPHSGNWSGYCAGVGFAGLSSAPFYQDSMLAYLQRSVNLSGLSSATLTFWFNIPSIESCCDSCQVYVDDTLVWLQQFSTAGWQQAVIDLAPFVGAPRSLSFEFVSDDSITAEGWYLDDILVSTGSAQPNLVPFQPSGWSGKIVISTVTNTTTDSAAFTPNDTLYVDWAVINEGPVQINAPFRVELYVDDVQRNTWLADPPLDPDEYVYVEDFSLGSLSAGTHTLRLRADSEGAVSESNEQDNEVTRTITVVGAADVRIDPLTLTITVTNPPSTLAASSDLTGDTPETTAQAQATLLPEQKLTDPEEILRGFEHPGQERVKVIVNLAPPSNPLLRSDWESKPKLRGWQQAVVARQEEVLAALAAGEFKLRHRFENQPGFSAEVTRAALDKLQRDPRVRSIEPVRPVRPHLAQGIPLMGAAVYRSTYNGAGVAVAIVDTGIDYRHPRLGGGGFPNGKVIGGYDFGDMDANPAPDGNEHGTACAGVVAGGLGPVGDYIGGVAYNAKLYALKVISREGDASDDAIIAAWNWCITHKNDDPANPLLVINTSFGSGRHFNSCDNTESAFAIAANNAAAAGIALLASAGNEGYCNAISLPACLSAVISVGSVYDSGYGTVGLCIDALSCAPKVADPTCETGFEAEDVTAADKVPSYSNTASFLDLLAPANRAYTTDIVGAGGSSSGDYLSNFGGTSAACPYASGAVAVLQSAARTVLGRFLTPAEVRTRLVSTGDHVTDTKTPITKPRINLARAIESLGQNNSFTIFNDGNTTLDVTGLQLDSPAAWLTWTPAAPFSIAPRAAQIVFVSVNAAQAPFGQTTHRLLVNSNDPDESPYPGGVFITVNKPDTRPILRARLAGGKVVISWTTNSAGYNLHATSTLVPASTWTLVGTPPVTVGAERFVTNNLTGGAMFFRLQK